MNEYYKILGIPPESGIQTIKKAYRIKVKEYHPDVSTYANAQEMFIKINEAYRCLLNHKLNLKNANETISHQEWINNRRERARREAAYHARIKYEAFKKSRVYKTARNITSILRYIYIIVSLLMIISPLYKLIFYGHEELHAATFYTGVFMVVIIGVVFLSLLVFKKDRFEF